MSRTETSAADLKPEVDDPVQRSSRRAVVTTHCAVAPPRRDSARDRARRSRHGNSVALPTTVARSVGTANISSKGSIARPGVRDRDGATGWCRPVRPAQSVTGRHPPAGAKLTRWEPVGDRRGPAPAGAASRADPAPPVLDDLAVLEAGNVDDVDLDRSPGRRWPMIEPLFTPRARLRTQTMSPSATLSSTVSAKSEDQRCRVQGWTPDEYEAWLAATLRQQLLGR